MIVFPAPMVYIMARPKLKNPRNLKIAPRVSAEEKAVIEQAANRSGQSINAWCRKAFHLMAREDGIPSSDLSAFSPKRENAT